MHRSASIAGWGITHQKWCGTCNSQNVTTSYYTPSCACGSQHWTGNHTHHQRGSVVNSNSGDHLHVCGDTQPGFRLHLSCSRGAQTLPSSHFKQVYLCWEHQPPVWKLALCRELTGVPLSLSQLGPCIFSKCMLSRTTICNCNYNCKLLVIQLMVIISPPRTVKLKKSKIYYR